MFVMYNAFCCLFIHFTGETSMMKSAALWCQSSCYALHKTFDCNSNAHALSVQQCNGYNCTLGCGSTNYWDQTILGCDAENCRLECKVIPKLTCIQNCTTGQNCEQQCNRGAHKCILRCDSKQQCTQICNHGKCDMECKGQNCSQKCNRRATKCSLQCNQHCMQTCNHGQCDMECHGQRCEQICNENASKCSLKCHSKQSCTQICKGDKCVLECHGPNCAHHISENRHSCQPKCQVASGKNHCDDKCTSTTTTTTKTTLVAALKTTLQYHPCRHFCSGEWSNCSRFCYSGQYCLDITTRE